MKHFAYAVTSTDPAPVGYGDAASWLSHYKLTAGDDVFIPKPPIGFEGIEKGDAIWFVVEGILHGTTVVTRIEYDAINDRAELWFDGSRIQHPSTEMRVGPTVTGELTVEEVKRWMPFLEAL